MATTPSPKVPTPGIPEYFDYIGVARKAGISQQDLRAIIHVFETDYPDDLMLRELHILRACRAIEAERGTVQDMLRAAPPASAA